MYDANGLQLWYDGFCWRADPFAAVRKRLLAFFGEALLADPRLTERVITLLSCLQDEHSSSILAFEHHTCDPAALRPRGPGYTDEQKRPLYPTDRLHGWLAELRPVIGPLNHASTVRDLPLSAVVGLLQVDGTHVIRDTGTIYRIAHHVEPSAGGGARAFAGTGRHAAQMLSEVLGTDGFVVKVSSNGGLYLFENNELVTHVSPVTGTSRYTDQRRTSTTPEPESPRHRSPHGPPPDPRAGGAE
ncbi:unnamed protein product [Gemmata massiliana]|uniref:DAC domain-containing protein n=1 Tax=Gemmata massiliana TaxID=1210884 RepID=A0A6P2CS04_9BACT|nr:hypothetical protein [Gemmata massiliana]VTR91703.1 unnamed protein product [Gemmata massiliana]